jgi:hypothetical protein
MLVVGCWLFRWRGKGEHPTSNNQHPTSNGGVVGSP